MNRILGQALSVAMKIYQMTLGTVLGGRCRFYPTCSEYSRQAFAKHGAARGATKTIWRLLRCNPWNPGGYDPT